MDQPATVPSDPSRSETLPFAHSSPHGCGPVRRRQPADAIRSAPKAGSTLLGGSAVDCRDFGNQRFRGLRAMLKILDVEADQANHVRRSQMQQSEFDLRGGASSAARGRERSDGAVRRCIGRNNRCERNSACGGRCEHHKPRRVSRGRFRVGNAREKTRQRPNATNLNRHVVPRQGGWRESSQ